MRLRLVVPTAVLLAAACFMLFGQDRSAGLADRLVRNGGVRHLDRDEALALTGFVGTLLKLESAETDIAINQQHVSGRLNIYVVDSEKYGGVAVPRGNAAYISSSDIIFIDAGYLRLGSRKVLSVADDTLDEKVLAPLRVYAYFILAHELGHRQLHRGWWRALTHFGGPSRETEADAFAIRVLQALYSTEDLRRSAHIPESLSALSGLFGEVTPLQRIVDHLSVAVSFLADDLFDSPFPLLSQTRTHPAFLGRFQALLNGLGEAAVAAGDEDAIRKMSVATSVLASTRHLLELRPSEIEFNNRFQYAYVDGSRLHVLGRDRQPITTIDLGDLEPGRQYRQAISDLTGEPTVRYAWSGRTGETMTLRRDGRLVAIRGESGDVVFERDLRGQLGDNSCVRQFILPPQPSDYVFATFCDAGQAGVAKIGRDGGVVRRRLKDLIGEVKAVGPDARPRTFDLDAAGRPVVNFSLGQADYRLSLSQDLAPQTPVRLFLGDERLWDAILVGPARLVAKTTISSASGEAFALSGSPIFRNVEMRSAETANAEPQASTGPRRIERFSSETLRIAASYPVGDNRLIVNLVEGGAYLADFGEMRLDPIRRRSFGSGEQIAANIHGDWIYYRKYDRRILLFRRPRSDKAN